jgi:hypothetical protein
MPTEETKKEPNIDPASPDPEMAIDESVPEETGKGNWREAFVAAFQVARKHQKPTESRQELGRDKSKSLFLLVGVCVALVLLFFGVFSHPKKKIPLPGENPHGQASLGRKVTPEQESKRSQHLGDAEAECRCAYLRSRHGRPINGGRHRPHFAHDHGAQTIRCDYTRG